MLRIASDQSPAHKADHALRRGLVLLLTLAAGFLGLGLGPVLPGQNLFDPVEAPAQDDEGEIIIIEPPLPESPDAPSGSPLPEPVFAPAGSDVILLEGPWLYRPENLLPPRSAAQGAYIPLPHTTARHPWAEPDLDPRELEPWRQMTLPGPWEKQAFAFDGIVWLRNRLMLPLAWENRDLLIHLGEIIGRDEVFFNGRRIGATALEQNPYRRDTARTYRVPGDLVRKGQNVIAIRLIDTRQHAGLTGWPEDLQIRAAESGGGDQVRPQSLVGPWRFAIESYDAQSPSNTAEAWHRPDFDDSHWQTLEMPGALSDDRFDFDGIIFFRRDVEIPDDWAGSPLTLELGRIADSDTTFFNGTVIGRTENSFNNAPLRRYMVPAELVRPGVNVITVRVFNGQFQGGFLGPHGSMRLVYGWPGIVALGDGEGEGLADEGSLEPSPAVDAIEIGAGFDGILQDVQEEIRPVRSHAKTSAKTPKNQDTAYMRPAKRKWPRRYPENAGDSKRLTAADLPGPDGLVYPDFRRAGLPGAPRIPDQVFAVEKFGAEPNDKLSDSRALQQAVDAAQKVGGGLVTLGAGEFLLDRPVFIRGDHIVLRGAGADKTQVTFQTEPQPHALNIIQPRESRTLTLADYVEVQANPDGLESLRLYLGNLLLGELTAQESAQSPYSLGRSLDKLRARLVDFRLAKTELRAVAQWDDGRQREVSLPVRTDFRFSPEPGTMRSGPATAAFIFRGGAQQGDARRWFLAKDGRRGDQWIELTDMAEFPPGSLVQLSARGDDDWVALLESARPSVPRMNRFIIEEIQGRRVRLNQPLRQDYPAAQEAGMLTLVQPIRGCGVENLALEQRGFLPYDGITFDEAHGCWVRGVNVQRIGRRPVVLRHAKFCEIRDSHFADAWNPPGSGAGQVGFETSWDCLIDHVTVERLAGSPSFSWGASGNVVRNSRFQHSGIVFPEGWATENLVENCEIDAGAGRYPGPAIVTAAPDNPETGPGGGPRNVFYHNRFRSAEDAIRLNGMEESWLFVRNRFVIRGGSLLHGRMHSIDHIFLHNIVSLAQPWQPALRLDDADCLGIVARQNIIYGTNRKSAGPGHPEVRDNEWVEGYLPDPPAKAPEIPSLSNWQKTHHPLPAKP